MTKEQIIEEAFKAMKNAYAPYSNYHVGACIVMKDGKYFYGANVENASYGAAVCAERNATFAAYSNGYRKEDIEALAIVSDGPRIAAPTNDNVPPSICTIALPAKSWKPNSDNQPPPHTQ